MSVRHGRNDLRVMAVLQSSGTAKTTHSTACVELQVPNELRG
jgi:hypothetical protein